MNQFMLRLRTLDKGCSKVNKKVIQPKMKKKKKKKRCALRGMPEIEN